ncbi:retropepsin-like aspartic protease [Pseudotenacibaculum haliotis]|uniref:Retropepsin-like aspartic protease n=1 Tax=Pseudotenacibaculum haliotis TaxID=1862138 RepID=A0ABW5LMN7_9FLAO
MKSIFNFFLFFCVFTAFASSDPNKEIDDIDTFHFTNAEVINKYTTRIPFKLVDRLIVIEGVHKKKKGWFVVDTGSEKLLLNKVHFSHLATRNNRVNKSSGVLDFVDNPIEKRVQQLSFQNLNIRDKRSDIIDLSHIEKSKKIKILGIIGYNILKDYEVFVDMYLNQITLTKIDTKGNKLGKQKYLEKVIDSIDFELKKHTIVIEGSINGKKLKFGLDTAAEFSQLNSKVSRKVLRSFYPKKRIKLRGASSAEIEVISGRLFKLKLSETVFFGPINTILTNLRSMNHAFGTKLDGVLGYDFFAQKRAIINYKKEKIYFINYPLIR